MNIIAGLLRGLAPLPQSDLRTQDEANGEAQAGNGNAFGNVLSELSQNSAADADGANSAPQQKPVSIRINPEDAQSESTDGSAVAGPSNATTVAQTLAALGDLAALTEQNAANAVNGNTKPANANLGANAQPPKDSLTNFFLTGEGQQSGPGTPTPAPETGSARQALGEGAASALGALANNAAASAQTANPGSAAPLNKPLANFTQGTTNNDQAPDIAATNPGTFGLTGPSLLTNSLATQVEAPTGGSTSGSKDSNKDAGQPNAPSSGSATITTAAFIADAAAMAAALQPTAPIAPTSGGTAGTRGDTDKPGAKSSSAARQSGPPADANTNAGNDQGTLPASVANLDGAFAANVSASVQPPEPARQAPAGASIPAGASAFASRGLAAANAASTIAPLPQTDGAEADADAPAPIKLAVLSTTTHFAPPAQLSPVQQIATAVAGAIPGLSPASGGTFGASSAAGDGDSTGGISNVSADPTNVALPGPAKVLNLQLEPPNLGTVTISLNLSDGGLDVQMAASQPATANLIERDKTALSDQLRDSGYSVASVAVSLDARGANVGNDGSATQGQANQGQANQAFSQNNGQDTSQGGASNGNGSTGQNGPDRSLPDSLAPIPDSIASVVTNGPASGELYI